MRTIVEIPAPLIKHLDDLGKVQKQSRAAIVRKAVEQYLNSHAIDEKNSCFGLWKKRNVDGVTYQKSLRDEWS